MFHNYQTREEIQKIIINALVALDRPSLETEVASWAWHRMAIDGIRSGVFKTISFEMRIMRADQVLRLQTIRDTGVGAFYVIHDPLSAMAFVAD